MTPENDADAKGMPQAGGAYMADPDQGVVQIEPPAADAKRARRIFGEPQSAGPTNQDQE